MSTKKDKFIESAQKFIIKGQLDKALKDFEQAVTLDPGDIKVRQRLAELLVRVNRQEEAIPEYETIAKFFADRCFFLKAIAVYKQVQKLDPYNIKTTLTLAELNVKQGLIGNALAEFSHLVNQHLKTGKHSEALKILGRMTEIDPGNLNTALKIAETNLAAGNNEEAYEHYCRLARQLLDHPDKSPFHHLCERINNLFPDKGCSPLGFIESQLEQGEAEKAFSNLKEFLSREPDNLKAWYLICDTFRALGEMGQLRSALTRMYDRFPDEIRHREELIDLTINEGDPDEALKLLDEHRAYLLTKGRAEQLEQFYSRLQGIADIDRRPFNGLQWLYAETGNRNKLRELTTGLMEIDLYPERSEPTETEPQPESFKGLLDETVCEEEQPEIPPQAAPTPQLTAEWEEDVDLELEEDQEELQPTATLVIEDDGWPDENEEPSRTTLTILSPLPIEAFLAPARLEAKNELQKTSRSALEELTEQLELEISSLPESRRIESHGLLAGKSEPFDWGATDNRISDFPTPIPQSDDHSTELIVDPHEALSTELNFEMEDLADFSEALFGEEGHHIGTFESDESDIYSLGNLLSAFKKGVDEQIDESDTESHYSLGIAYKEMGLYDEAVREFRSAARDPRRSSDCTSLEGICLRDKGDFAAAEMVFKTALALPALSGEALLNTKYELAFLYELSGRPLEAVTVYHEIVRVEPVFRDVKHRLFLLSSEDPEDILEPEMIELEDENPL